MVCQHQDACTVSGVSFTHTSTRIHCTVSGVPAPGCMHCERCVVHSYQHQDALYCKWCASTRMHALWAVCCSLIPATGYMYCLCMHGKGIVKDKCQFTTYSCQTYCSRSGTNILYMFYSLKEQSVLYTILHWTCTSGLPKRTSGSLQ